MQSPETRASEAPASPDPAAAAGGRNPLRQKVALIVAAAVVLVAIAGYGLFGITFAAARISSADKTLNTVISHQNSLNKTLDDVNSTFSVLSGSAAYNPQAAKTAVDQFVAGASSATATVRLDDGALVKSASSLNDQPWLTALARASLDREAQRIAHARKALVAARTVSAGYELDGQFWEAFISSTQDLDAVTVAASSSDWATAATKLAVMKADVDTALQDSGAPGLPPELHSLMADFQTFVSDYGKLVTASQAGDNAAVSSETTAIQADAAKLGAYNFDQITAELAAFYKPMIDTFNSEMALATS